MIDDKQRISRRHDAIARDVDEGRSPIGELPGAFAVQLNDDKQEQLLIELVDRRALD